MVQNLQSVVKYCRSVVKNCNWMLRMAIGCSEYSEVRFKIGKVSLGVENG